MSSIDIPAADPSLLGRSAEHRDASLLGRSAEHRDASLLGRSAEHRDAFDLTRFIEAQSNGHGAGNYDTACRELEAGQKRSHWMWFVFPQLRGLGHSQTAQHFGIASLAEAEAYLEHPLLGHRLRHVTAMVLAIEGSAATDVFGSPDDMKLRSSMTLFSRASGENAAFLAVLQRFYGGRPDPATVRLLGFV